MPKAKKSRTVTQDLQLQRSRAKRNFNGDQKDIEQTLYETQDKYSELIARHSELKEKLTQTEVKLAESQANSINLEKKLTTAKERNITLQAQLNKVTKNQAETYRQLRNERRTRQYATKRKDDLKKKLSDLKKAHVESLQQIKSLEKENKQDLEKVNLVHESTEKDISKQVQTMASELSSLHELLKTNRAVLIGHRSQNYKLRKKEARAARVKDNAIQRAKAQVAKEQSTFYLIEKGVYSNETRELVRTLTEANVSSNHIMTVIEAVLNAAGVKPVGRMCPRTVGRIIEEGYYAACVQLGYELTKTDAFTTGADGTSHKNLNYNSRFAHYKVTKPSGETEQVTRFLGLERSLDGSSEESVKEWESQLQNIFNLYNASPLANETNSFARLVEMYTKFVGMHSDHCAKEKKDFQLMGQKKKAATYQVLGEKRILEGTVEELLPEFINANRAMINDVGGQIHWDKLSEAEQNERKAAMLEKLTTDIGKDTYEKLSGKEKSLFKLFVWVGCGCHKDLNTVLGGYVYLSKFWSENNLQGPILLPNKHNAAIIEDASVQTDNDLESDAVRQAIKNSTKGAVKATKIAGDILNNKNDKAGHHDEFRTWWKDKVGFPFTFPDTSNTRFQSNCEASAALTLYREKFLEYMQYAEQKKNKGKATNMEENFVLALKDIPTRTELAVMAIYAEAVSHPYMKTLRGDSTLNGLSLGPLNKKIQSFIERIIEDPTFLVGENVTHETGTFDGQPWHSKNVVDRVNQIAPELPHLLPAIKAFFQGALESWKRFTSEYSPGGLIDEATIDEKEIAWMPSTNDINEGALGQFRVMIRRQPQLTLLKYNARTMFARNNTAEFMKEMFTDDTHKYIRKLAREKNTAERERLRDIVKHAEDKIAKKQAAKKVRETKAREAANHIATIKLEFDKKKVDGMKGEKLRDHFVAFKTAGAPMPSNVKKNSKVGELKDAIKMAIDLYNQKQWTIQGSTVEVEETQDNEGEEFEGYEDVLSDEDE